MMFCHWVGFLRIGLERIQGFPVVLPIIIKIFFRKFLTEIKGSSAGRCVHIYKILFKALRAFYFKSSAELGNLYTARRWEGTSKSAMDLACVPECPPI